VAGTRLRGSSTSAQTAERMTELERLFRAHVCQTSDSPMAIEIERAEGSRIVARDGREYLDLLAGMGVANVGHAHPEVVAAVREQAGRYLHAMVYGEYVQEPQVRLASRLVSLLPAPLEVVYFTNSGTEAIEGAIKAARKATARRCLVAFEGSFHGDTTGALALGGNPIYRTPFEPLLDVRRLPFGEEDRLGAIDESVAAVFVEPIQAEGGVRLPPPGFLESLRRRCTEVGALLVYDEVVTGLGRTGRRFGFEWDGAIPDVLVLAKALGGGMPLGAFVSSRGILATLAVDPPLGHVTTFGGHPVSCAAGLAALEVLEREQLWLRAEAIGERLRAELRGLSWGDRLRDLRGRGALVGLELADAVTTRAFTAGCFASGLVLNWTLHRDRVVRLAPPLVLGDDDLDRALEIMDAVVRRIRNQ
jgi:acetylornithine/N-succinyldiaminopimelate aminotransferase